MLLSGVVLLKALKTELEFCGIPPHKRCIFGIYMLKLSEIKAINEVTMAHNIFE
jgi:hypothetical protein